MPVGTTGRSWSYRWYTSDDHANNGFRFGHCSMRFFCAACRICFQLGNDFVAFYAFDVLKVAFDSIKPLGGNKMDILACLRHELESLLAVGIAANEGCVAAYIVRDDCAVNMAAEDVSDVDPLGRILADNGLALLLIGGTDLMPMYAKEGFVVQLEYGLVGIKLVEPHALVFDCLKDHL